jgi:hypothetical protein
VVVMTWPKVLIWPVLPIRSIATTVLLEILLAEPLVSL